MQVFLDIRKQSVAVDVDNRLSNLSHYLFVLGGFSWPDAKEEKIKTYTLFGLWLS